MTESTASSGQGECIIRLDGEEYRVYVSSTRPRIEGKVLLLAELPSRLVASREHACTAVAEMLLNARRGKRVAKNPYLNLVAFLLGVRSIARIVELVERLRGEEKVYIIVASSTARVEGLKPARFNPEGYLEALRMAGARNVPRLRGEAVARYAATRTSAFSISLKL